MNNGSSYSFITLEGDQIILPALFSVLALTAPSLAEQK